MTLFVLLGVWFCWRYRPVRYLTLAILIMLMVLYGVPAWLCSALFLRLPIPADPRFDWHHV